MEYTIVEDGTVINIIVVNQGDSSDAVQMIEDIIKRLSKQRHQGGGGSCCNRGCNGNNYVHCGYIHTGGYGGGNGR